MADESDDNTCNQIGEKSAQVKKTPVRHGSKSSTDGPVNSKDTHLTSAHTEKGKTPSVNSRETSQANAQTNNAETPAVNSKNTPQTCVQSQNEESPPLSSEGTPQASAQPQNDESPPLNSKNTPQASAFYHKEEILRENRKDTPQASAQLSNEERHSLNSKNTFQSSAQTNNDKSPPLSNKDTLQAGAQSNNEENNLPLNSQDTFQSSTQSHNKVCHPVNKNDTFLSSAQSLLNSKDNAPASAQSHNKECPPVNKKNTILPSAQSSNEESPEMNSKDTTPASAQSHSEKAPPVNSKDTSPPSHPVNNEDTSLPSSQSNNEESPPPYSKESPLSSGQSQTEKKPSINNNDSPLTSAQSQSEESSKDTTGDVENSPVNCESPTAKVLKDWRYAAIGMAAGAAAVVAAPVVLGAAGITAGGVAAGSLAATLQTVFYGAAGKAAIGGITGGIAAVGTKMFDNRTDIKLLICGCGSEAHVLAAVASSVKGTQVRMLTSSQLLTNRWNSAVEKNDLEVIFHRKGKEPTSIIASNPGLATNDPEDAMRDVDIVAFLLPAFAHEVLLDTLKPHIKPGTIIVGLPGGPGFEFQIREVLGDVAQQCTIVNFESSPWVCRTTAFGVRCEVLGTMDTLLGAMKQGEGADAKKDSVSTLQYLLGPLPKLNISGHLLGVGLMSANAYLHTSLLHGQWEGWDGQPIDQPPLFYNGLTESAADLLSSVSDEIVNIGNALELSTEADMSNVIHIHQWHVRRYHHDISIKSTLYKAIQTNAAYQGLKHPVKATENGKFVPDFTRRFMTEDVPYGLVVIRGIAEIVGVKTPNIDKVLTWCQEKMGKEYLVDSKIQGKDVWLSRAPQRYGLTTLESIL